MIRRPFALTISIRPPTGSTACAGGSGVIVAGTKLASAPSPPSRCNRRHVKICCREIPCRRAVAEAARGCDKLSATIRSFSSSVQRRRRPGINHFKATDLMTVSNDIHTDYQLFAGRFTQGGLRRMDTLRAPRERSVDCLVDY